MGEIIQKNKEKINIFFITIPCKTFSFYKKNSTSEELFKYFNNQ